MPKHFSTALGLPDLPQCHHVRTQLPTFAGVPDTSSVIGHSKNISLLHRYGWVFAQCVTYRLMLVERQFRASCLHASHGRQPLAGVRTTLLLTQWWLSWREDGKGFDLTAEWQASDLKDLAQNEIFHFLVGVSAHLKCSSGKR